MVLILIFITTILSGYVAGQTTTYTRNELICTTTSGTTAATVTTYTLTFDGTTNKYGLTASAGTSTTADCTGCKDIPKFATSTASGAPTDGNQITRTVPSPCKLDTIPIESFFTGATTSTVDMICNSATDCQRIRYDRTGASAFTATNIGACTLNACAACTSVTQWTISSDGKSLTRTSTTPTACLPWGTVSVFDYFLINSTLTTTTTSTTPSTTTTRKVSTNLIWSFGTITINLIGFLLINGLK